MRAARLRDEFFVNGKYRDAVRMCMFQPASLATRGGRADLGRHKKLARCNLCGDGIIPWRLLCHLAGQFATLESRGHQSRRSSAEGLGRKDRKAFMLA